MSGTKRKYGRIAKAILAFLCVPILISGLMILMVSLLQFAIELMPESWNLETPFIGLVIAWGAWFCVPVAWFMGPLIFMDNESGSRHLLRRQAAIGGCVGGFFGLIFAGMAASSAGLFAVILIGVGAVLGVIHALGLRYALLWLGLISPTNGMEVDSEDTARRSPSDRSQQGIAGTP